MEQLEIHSRSYLVRWVEVKGEHTISWSVQPHKKSVNFGIFKHPGSGLAPTPRVPSATFEAPTTPGLKPSDAKSTEAAADGPSVAIEKLKAIGVSLQHWHGKCEANAVTTGTYDVGKAEGGMYALVFDNTFSKSIAKTVTFVLLTYPTNARHEVRHTSNAGIAASVASRTKDVSGRPRRSSRVSNDSAQSRGPLGSPNEAGAAFMDASKVTEQSLDANFFTGILQKRRRKRGQGYARRFFSLDFTSSTLSYYHNRRTLSIRGAVPLSLAAIGTNAATREISIDSGAEVWHLKALNAKDFENWRRALETAATSGSMDASTTATVAPSLRHSMSYLPRDVDEERDWQRVEELVSRVSLARDVARRIARDMDPRYLPVGMSHAGVSTGSLGGYASGSDAGSPSDRAQEDYFGSSERKSFWKRKTSVVKPSILSNARKASSPGVAPGARIPSPTNADMQKPTGLGLQRLIAEEGLHEQALELMKTLDAVISDFSTVITDSKQRRLTIPNLASSRLSIDSAGSQEFFDAEVGESQLLTIQQDSDSEIQSPDREFTTDDAEEESSASEIEEEGVERSALLRDELSALFPAKSKLLDLSSVQPVKRRSSIPPPVQPPPSLIGFLRKNVGKDLSTVAMPVSANEPISLLQKMEETLEYSQLLDDAASSSLSPTERLLHVTAFAISALSSNRVKERAIRKPFNPMLGETYEAMREDRGYRFIAEKVSHRPVRIAWHAEGAHWSLAQAPMPTQKFWGKSAELILDGRLRLYFPETGDRYAWLAPTCFLRNILAGEKYVEPVGTFTVQDERSGMHAVVEFAKAKGLFAGRSEGLTVRLFAAGDSQPLSMGLVGKWTTSVVRCAVPTGAPIAAQPDALWKAGKLVPDAPLCYGFTAFAATLNELLSRDAEALPPSDSRRRPDQRAAEEGDLPAAESLKAQLEEAQRERRRTMEARAEAWVPSWFVQVPRPAAAAGAGDEDEVWRLKTGKEGYWESRARGDWKAAKRVFEL